jgi:hypothetical protein
MTEVVAYWARLIAERVAPLEADSAAEVGAAYVAGGDRRRELFERRGGLPGAFGLGGLAGELPHILRALDQSCDALLALLGSSAVGNAIQLATLRIAVRTLHATQEGGHGLEGSRPPGARLGTRNVTGTCGGRSPGLSPAGVAERDAGPNARQLVESAFEMVNGGLTAQGVRPEEAAEMARGVLESFLADTAAAAGAAEFVAALAAAPDEARRGWWAGGWLRALWRRLT